MNVIKSLNPTTEEPLGEIRFSTTEEVKKSVNNLSPYSETLPLKDRIKKVFKIADKIEANKDELAELVSKEIRRPITASKKIIYRIPYRLRYLANNAEEVLAPQTIEHADGIVSRITTKYFIRG